MELLRFTGLERHFGAKEVFRDLSGTLSSVQDLQDGAGNVPVYDNASGSNVYSNSGINQDVDAQNVIRFMSGSSTIGQNESRSTKSFTNTANQLVISENLTPAYSRNAGLVSSWLRDLTYDRTQHSLRVNDRCTVASSVTPVWQLHTPVQPVRQSDGSYLAGTLRITPVAPASPTATIVSMRSVNGDYSSGYRLDLRGPAGTCAFTVQLTAQ